MVADTTKNDSESEPVVSPDFPVVEKETDGAFAPMDKSDSAGSDVEARADPITFKAVHENIYPVSENGPCLAAGIIGPM